MGLRVLSGRAQEKKRVPSFWGEKKRVGVVEGDDDTGDETLLH